MNSRTTIFGILTVISEVLRNNPSLLSFLPPNIQNMVLGISSIVFAVVTAIAMADKQTKGEIAAKQVAKALEKEVLKTEIKEEAKLVAINLATETVATATALAKEELVKELPSHVEAIVAPIRDDVETLKNN